MTGRDVAPSRTPDGRYIVIRGRLWRSSNPALDKAERQRLVDKLMNARRAVKEAKGERLATMDARRKVNEAKTALGERGPVWWGDGTPDLNRHLVASSQNSPAIVRISRNSDRESH